MRFIFSILVPFIFILALFAFTGRQQQPIHLDGVISGDEWKPAKEFPLTGGGKLLLLRQASVLYAALVAGKKGWAHVYIGTGDTVRVLHASAALGEAVYIKTDELWRPIQQFEWKLRERVYNQDLQEKQAAYFKQYHWVANNTNTGDGKTFEFMIDLPASDNVSLACLVLDEPTQPHYYPQGLNDNTILPRLMQGYTPDSLHFSPGTWDTIK